MTRKFRENSVKRSDFDFFEITGEAKKNFRALDSGELSSFNEYALKKIGDAIRGVNSQQFWRNGCYCWYTDETQTSLECVWITGNGIAMYEKLREGKLYRILFKH